MVLLLFIAYFFPKNKNKGILLNHDMSINKMKHRALEIVSEDNKLVMLSL